MSFVGMETDQGRDHAQRLRTAGQRMDEVCTTLDSEIRASTTSWIGPDAEGFRGRWSAGTAPLLRQLVDELQRCAATLERDADQQDEASASDTAGQGAGGEVGPDGGRGSAPPGARHGGGGDGQVSPEVAAAWEDMDEPDRERVLREIAKQELAKYGAPELDLYFDPDTGVLGYWTPFDGWHPLRGEHIVIDESTLGDPDVMNTVAHEARHAAQNQWVEDTEAPPGWQFWREDESAAEYDRIEREHGVTQEEIEAWRENEDDYVPPPEDPQPAADAPQEEHDAWKEEYDAYREQPLEEDAFDTGDEFAEGMTMDDLRRYQEDAGVPVSP
jgi:uncharacterized protein YukE